MPRGRPKALDLKYQFELRLAREAGISIRECCSYFGISRSTALEYLAQMRKRMGPEKVKDKSKMRWHLTNRPENFRTSNSS